MSRAARRPRLVLVAILAASLLPGCTSSTRGHAVPVQSQTKAFVAGLPYGMRYFPRDPERIEVFKEDFRASWSLEKAYLRAQGQTGPLPRADYLAISGGGDNGAFGAGLLVGWTRAGTRPTFKLVTGISTGALIAPFAFLGPDYDESLKSVFTNVSLKDIAKTRSMFSVVFSDAMADSRPLQNLIRLYVDQKMLDAIAAEHEKGRILLIGTTNLDARRPVIWNITKIAATRSPKALDLVQKILLASAAIPGTFPPVMIDVEFENHKYQEMHVDGGTTAQVFIYPAGVRLEELAGESGATRERKLYIIRNARLDPDWAEVDRRTLPIALRAVLCLIQYQGLSDLYRLYTVTGRDNVDYNLAYVPPTFQVPHTADFDTAYMRALFDVGYAAAAAGYPWAKEPPVLVSGPSDSTGSR